MILTTLDSLQDYTHIHQRVATVLEYIQAHPLHTLPEGKNIVDGDNAFIIVDSCSPKAKESALLEAHERYLDIQVLLEGEESMGWAPVADMKEIDTPYNPDKDIVFYADKTQNYVHLTPGMVAVFMPADAHAPAICSTPIHKAVIKILV